VIQKVSLKAAILVMGLVVTSMLAFGIRLATVKSGRFGRMKEKE